MIIVAIILGAALGVLIGLAYHIARRRFEDIES